MAAVSPVGRAAGLEPLGLHAGANTAGALYEHHSRRVFAYCLSKLGRREDAEDAVQTTFLHAVRGLRRGVVPSVELAWLLGIARNVCLSRRESAGRRGRLELVCDPVDLERAAARQGRGDELIGLDEALAQLPEQQRRAVLLRDWRGLSYEEVAAQLGVSLANAETLIFRGRRTLAGLLREEPAATRRRLASLGNIGSLLTWVKSAFTGVSTAAKVAAVVSAVAVSGTVIAAGTATARPGDGVSATPPSSITPSGAAPGTPSVRPAASAATPNASAPAFGTATPAASAPRSQPATTSAAPPTVPSEAAPADAPPSAERTSPVATPTAQPTVADTVPALPLATPLPDVVGSLPVPQLPPVVGTVVDAVPPVTVTPPPAVPVEPVTDQPVAVDVRSLLP